MEVHHKTFVFKLIRAMIAILLMMGLLNAFPRAAVAGGHCDPANGDGLHCGDHGGNGGQGGGGGGGQGGAPKYPFRYVSYFTDQSGHNYFCLRTGYARTRELANHYRDRISEDIRLAESDGIYRSEPCPDFPPPPPLVRRDVRDAIEKYWNENKTLPYPSMRLNPSRVITGVPAFLTIAGSSSFSFDLFNTVQNEPIHVDATSSYEINWGDPQNPDLVYTTSHGGDAPHGDLFHSYSQAGTVKIGVRQLWRAHWFEGAEQGWVNGLVTTGTLANISVQQLEAGIRTR